MKTYADLAAFLEVFDGLDLPAGSWVATDCDGTLWACDVADEGWRRVIAERRLRPDCAPALARILAEVNEEPSGDVHRDAERAHQLFVEHRTSEGALINGMTQCYAGWSRAEVEAFAAELAVELAPRGYATSAPLLTALRERGMRPFAVSGSPTILVAAAIRALGVEAPPVLGTDLHESSGVLTDTMREPVTWNDGKVLASRTLVGDAPITVAFGDSLGDLQLLEATSALKVLVHPRPGLVQAGRAGEGTWCVFAPGKTVGGQAVVPPSSDHFM